MANLNSIPDNSSISAASSRWGSNSASLSLSPKSRVIAKDSSNHHHHPKLDIGHGRGCHIDAADHNSINYTYDDHDNNDNNGGSQFPAMVRVVQIFNPVLVKTDVANFRSLVQRLTGKSGCSRYWNKLRKLNICSKGAMVEVQGESIDMLDAMVGAERSDHASFGAHHGAEFSQATSPAAIDHEYHHQGGGGGVVHVGSNSAFSELDIYAGLVSDGPLPDITMLPPLPLTLQNSRELMSLCI